MDCSLTRAGNWLHTFLLHLVIKKKAKWKWDVCLSFVLAASIPDHYHYSPLDGSCNCFITGSTHSPPPFTNSDEREIWSFSQDMRQEINAMQAINFVSLVASNVASCRSIWCWLRVTQFVWRGSVMIKKR